MSDSNEHGTPTTNADKADQNERVVMPDCYPEHDLENGANCWCDPEIEHTDGARIITHREVH